MHDLDGFLCFPHLGDISKDYSGSESGRENILERSLGDLAPGIDQKSGSGQDIAIRQQGVDGGQFVNTSRIVVGELSEQWELSLAAPPRRE